MSWISGHLSSITNQLSSATQEFLAEGTSEIRDINAELKNAKKKIESLQYQVEACKSELNTSRDEINELNLKIESLTLENVHLKEDLDARLQEKDEQIKNLTNQVKLRRGEPEGECSSSKPSLKNEIINFASEDYSSASASEIFSASNVREKKISGEPGNANSDFKEYQQIIDTLRQELSLSREEKFQEIAALQETNQFRVNRLQERLRETESALAAKCSPNDQFETQPMAHVVESLEQSVQLDDLAENYTQFHAELQWGPECSTPTNKTYDSTLSQPQTSPNVCAASLDMAISDLMAELTEYDSFALGAGISKPNVTGSEDSASSSASSSTYDKIADLTNRLSSHRETFAKLYKKHINSTTVTSMQTVPEITHVDEAACMEKDVMSRSSLYSEKTENLQKRFDRLKNALEKAVSCLPAMTFSPSSSPNQCPPWPPTQPEAQVAVIVAAEAASRNELFRARAALDSAGELIGELRQASVNKQPPAVVMKMLETLVRSFVELLNDGQTDAFLEAAETLVDEDPELQELVELMAETVAESNARKSESQHLTSNSVDTQLVMLFQKVKSELNDNLSMTELLQVFQGQILASENDQKVFECLKSIVDRLLLDRKNCMHAEQENESLRELMAQSKGRVNEPSVSADLSQLVKLVNSINIYLNDDTSLKQVVGQIQERNLTLFESEDDQTIFYCLKNLFDKLTVERDKNQQNENKIVTLKNKLSQLAENVQLKHLLELTKTIETALHDETVLEPIAEKCRQTSDLNSSEQAISTCFAHLVETLLIEKNKIALAEKDKFSLQQKMVEQPTGETHIAGLNDLMLKIETSLGNTTSLANFTEESKQCISTSDLSADNQKLLISILHLLERSKFFQLELKQKPLTLEVAAPYNWLSELAVQVDAALCDETNSSSSFDKIVEQCQERSRMADVSIEDRQIAAVFRHLVEAFIVIKGQHAKSEQDRVTLGEIVRKKHAESQAYHAQLQQMIIDRQSVVTSEEIDSGKLTFEVNRLRSHLLQIEENQTREALAAEEREASLRVSLAAERKRLDELNKFVTSAEDQLTCVREERDAARVASRDNLAELASLRTSHENLQRALEQLEKAKQMDVNAETQHFRRETARLRSESTQLASRVAELQASLSRQEEVVVANRVLHERIESHTGRLSEAHAQARRYEEQIQTLKKKLEQKTVELDGKMDKSLMKNLLISCLKLPPAKRPDAFRTFGSVLNFTSDDYTKLGFGEPVGKNWRDWFWSPSVASATDGDPEVDGSKGSFIEQFAHFLERESAPPSHIRLPIDHLGSASHIDGYNVAASRRVRVNSTSTLQQRPSIPVEGAPSPLKAIAPQYPLLLNYPASSDLSTPPKPTLNPLLSSFARN